MENKNRATAISNNCEGGRENGLPRPNVRQPVCIIVLNKDVNFFITTIFKLSLMSLFIFMPLSRRASTHEIFGASFRPSVASTPSGFLI